MPLRRRYCIFLFASLIKYSNLWLLLLISKRKYFPSVPLYLFSSTLREKVLHLLSLPSRSTDEIRNLFVADEEVLYLFRHHASEGSIAVCLPYCLWVVWTAWLRIFWPGFVSPLPSLHRDTSKYEEGGGEAPQLRRNHGNAVVVIVRSRSKIDASSCCF